MPFKIPVTESTLVNAITWVAASYRSLHDARAGRLDSRFQWPAEKVLTMIAWRSGFALHPSLQSLCDTKTITKHNLSVADSILRKEHRRPQWQVFSVEASSDEFKDGLWQQIRAAADGFLKSGYDTYTVPETPHDWAAQVLKQT